MSWLAHLTGTKNKSASDSGRSPDRASAAAVQATDSNKKKKLYRDDVMDTEGDIDEGAFYWVADDDDRAVPKPPAFSPAAAASSSYPFSLSSSTSTSTSITTTTTPSSGPATEVLPPYRRPGHPSSSSSSTAPPPPLYPQVFSSTSSAPALPQPFALYGGVQHTPAHVPLQGCSSFKLNPRLTAQAAPPPHVKLAMSDLLAKMKEMDAKLKQRPTYDPCFEVEIIAQTKVDRRKQEHMISSLEERYSKQRELIEAEAKRLQDIAITEWVEQQQQQCLTQQESGDGQSSEGPPSTSATSQALLDLSFPSPRLGHVSESLFQSTQQRRSENEPPPPYPGPTTSQPIHFPTPPLASDEQQQQQQQHFSATTPAAVHFPTPLQQQQPPSSMLFIGHPYFHSPFPAAAATAAAPPLAHAHPGRNGLPFAAPTVAVQPPLAVVVPLPGGRQGVPSSAVSAPVNHTTAMTALPPPRMTMEDYQRKYPVLTNPERRAIFIQLLEMRFKPEIAALGLEVYPDNKVDKIVTFVANFHKLAEMGFSPERIKQALLLHEDVQNAIAYLHELDSLVRAGIKEAEIFDAIMLFDNNIQKASAFLKAHKALAQFGFDDLRIREALLMCDNDQEKAAKYLMNA